MSNEAVEIVRSLVELAAELDDVDGDYCHFCDSHCTQPHEDDCLLIRAKTFIEAYDRETIAHSTN